MKSVITASVIFILIIIMIAGSIWYVNAFTEEISLYIEKYEKYIAKNEWDSAYTEIQKTEKLWEQHRQKIAVILNHSYMDKLDLSVLKLKNAVILRKKEDCYYEKNNFLLILKNIKEQQQISIGNIF